MSIPTPRTDEAAGVPSSDHAATAERLYLCSQGLECENVVLRRIVADVVTALANGASCSVDSSLEFMRSIPAEVRLVVQRLKAQSEPRATKLLVVGGRDYVVTDTDLAFLDELRRKYQFSEIITGGSAGVDRSAEAWANKQGIPVQRVLPDWSKGPGSEFFNHTRLATCADAVAAFPGGGGTQHMVDTAKARGMTLFEAPSRLAGISVTVLPEPTAPARHSIRP